MTWTKPEDFFLRITMVVYISTPTGWLTTYHRRQLRVWDLETLECEHVLKPTGKDVFVLVAVEGTVWGGVGEEVVVWGRSA